jgi:hypothetical protein
MNAFCGWVHPRPPIPGSDRYPPTQPHIPTTMSSDSDQAGPSSGPRHVQAYALMLPNAGWWRAWASPACCSSPWARRFSPGCGCAAIAASSTRRGPLGRPMDSCTRTTRATATSGTRSSCCASSRSAWSSCSSSRIARSSRCGLCTQCHQHNRSLTGRKLLVRFARSPLQPTPQPTPCLLFLFVFSFYTLFLFLFHAPTLQTQPTPQILSALGIVLLAMVAQVCMGVCCAAACGHACLRAPAGLESTQLCHNLATSVRPRTTSVRPFPPPHRPLLWLTRPQPPLTSSGTCPLCPPASSLSPGQHQAL